MPKSRNIICPVCKGKTGRLADDKNTWLPCDVCHGVGYLVEDLEEKITPRKTNPKERGSGNRQAIFSLSRLLITFGHKHPPLLRST